MNTTKRTWMVSGNCLVITIPMEIREALNIQEGDIIEVDIKSVVKKEEQTQEGAIEENSEEKKWKLSP